MSCPKYNNIYFILLYLYPFVTHTILLLLKQYCLSEVSVRISTLEGSTHLRAAAHPRPTSPWQDAKRVLFVVDGNLLGHQLVLGADLLVDAHRINHSASATMAADPLV